MSNGTCCGQKGAANLLATTGRHQSPPTGKDQSTFAPQTTSIRKRTPSSKKTVKSYSEMNLAEFCRRRRSGKIPLMKASCGTFLCAKQLIIVTEKKTFPKIGMKFKFRGTQSCRNRREGAFGRGRKEKDQSLVIPRKRLNKSMTVGDNGKMSLMEFQH